MSALSALRAFAFGTLAWTLGLALAVVVGFALGLSLPGPAGIVGGGLVLGAIVGLAQRRVMRGAGLRLVVVTSLATPLAFLSVAFLAAQLELPGLTALTGPLVVAAQIRMGDSAGQRPPVSLGAVAGMMGWGIAVGAFVVPGLPTAVRVAGLFVPGAMAAIYTILSRPPRARTPGAIGSAPSMRPRPATS